MARSSCYCTQLLLLHPTLAIAPNSCHCTQLLPLHPALAIPRSSCYGIQLLLLRPALAITRSSCHYMQLLLLHPALAMAPRSLLSCRCSWTLAGIYVQHWRLRRGAIIEPIEEGTRGDGKGNGRHGQNKRAGATLKDLLLVCSEHLLLALSLPSSPVVVRHPRQPIRSLLSLSFDPSFLPCTNAIRMSSFSPFHAFRIGLQASRASRAIL
jgi:hypothetical protein